MTRLQLSGTGHSVFELIALGGILILRQRRCWNNSRIGCQHHISCQGNRSPYTRPVPARRLKVEDLDVIRASLQRFYSYATDELLPVL